MVEATGAESVIANVKPISMRFLVSIVFALCCTSCQHSGSLQIPQPAKATYGPGQSDSRWLFESQFGATKYDFAVSDTLLHRVSQWKADKDPLPLSPRRAEYAAIAEARRLAPDVSYWGDAFDIVLRRVDANCWYYEVLLLRGDVVIMGLPPDNYFLKIPVLMNGAAVPPVSSY